MEAQINMPRTCHEDKFCPIIPNLGARLRYVVSFTPRPTCTRWKETPVPTAKGACVSSKVGVYDWREKISCCSR